MKNARNATRKNSESPSPMEQVDDSEDELLLSPPKQPKPSGSKRSVSPPPKDEYSSGATEDTHGRELKRMKWDLEGKETKNPIMTRLVKPGHARTNSEPNIGSSRKASRKRAGTASASNKPHSMSNIKPTPVAEGPTGLPGKTRAQSVPLFPSSSSLPSLPSLDLRNPPISPIRPRSPSRPTDKSHGLKVHPSPSKPSLSEHLPTTETPPDEPKARMDVVYEPTGHLVLEADTVMEHVDDHAKPTSELSTFPSEEHNLLPGISVQPPESPAPTVPLVTPLHHPVTPVPSGLSLFASMSPLTPLPETPLPPRDNDREEERYTVKEGWSFEPEKEPGVGLSLHPIPQPNFGEPKANSGIPTPSIPSRSQIPRPSMGPPPPLPDLLRPDPGKSAQTSLKPIRKGSSVPLKPDTLTLLTKNASSSISSPKTNAFAVLMNASKQGVNQQQNKDKGKGISLLPKAVPGPGTSNVKGKEKAEPETKKLTLKDKMRRSQKKKPEVPSKFVPQVFDDDEELEEEKEAEFRIPLPSTSESKEQLFPPSMEEKIVTSNQSTSLALPVQQDAPVAGPSEIHRLTPITIENEESAPKPRSPSPISPLSELETESTGFTNVELDSTAPVPPPVEDGLTSQQERMTTPTLTILDSVLLHNDQGSEANPFVDSTTEPPAVESLKEAEGPIDQLQETAPADGHSQADKLKPAPRKRRKSGIPTSTRVTRSAFKPPPPAPPNPTRRPRANSVIPHKTRSAAKKTSSGKVTMTEPDEMLLSQGSPMQTSSPIRNIRTPGSSPAKISLAKTPSKPNFSQGGSPSPTKITRAMSMFNRSADKFAIDDIGVNPNGSSLSTLSTALEKLKMPAPSRPNTSLGFNPDSGHDDDDDAVIPFEINNKHVGLRRANSMERSSATGYAGSSKPLSSSSQAGTSTGKPRLVQKPMTLFFSKSGSSSTSTSTSSNPRSAKQALLGGARPSLIGPGFKGKGKGLFNGGGGLVPANMNKRLVQKASRKTTLPTVEASPVKGGAPKSLDANDGDSGVFDASASTSGEAALGGHQEAQASEDMNDVFVAPLAKDNDEVKVPEANGPENSEKGKEKEKDRSKAKDSSRRASMALSQLSQSLSAAPAYGTSIKGIMGPPATPRKIARSVSSNYPAASTAAREGPPTGTDTADATGPSRSSTSPDRVLGSGGKRSSARQAAKAALNTEARSPSTSAGPSGSVKKAGPGKDKASTKKTESLGVLKDCRIFVDVRTDDGEEAGSLFVEMLESLGAKVQSRVGQACTHVIFKNGLMSTTTRYRLLRDPKPSVVGIAWVVECVEQRCRVEEAPFLIDINEMSVAGANKRRRSMLPKFISNDLVDATATDIEPEDGEDGDVSMDGSTSSLTMDDDLTPLERARRRRSMIFGPAT